MNDDEVLKETSTVREIKGIKKFVRFTTIIYVLSIIICVLGIASCVIRGSVEVWEHIILWIALIISDSTILIFVRSIKNGTVTIEERENN